MTEPQVILADLAETIDWPTPPPHLAVRVRAHIDKSPPGRVRFGLTWALVVAVVLILALLPGPRQALADLAVEAGVRLGIIDETPIGLGSDLDLGEPMTLAEAATSAGLPLRVPEELGTPDAVLVGHGRVTMIWAGTELHPAAVGSDIGVLLSQGTSDTPYAQKGIGPETVVDYVQVGEGPGLWIEGAMHAFALTDPEGNPMKITTRLAANVLLWEVDGVDHRLELTGDLTDALTIARSLED